MPEINELISTRGMAGMMNTIWLIICAMCFEAEMTAGGDARQYHFCICTFSKSG